MLSDPHLPCGALYRNGSKNPHLAPVRALCILEIGISPLDSPLPSPLFLGHWESGRLGDPSD